MNTEDSEFERIAEEAKRRAAQKPSMTKDEALKMALGFIERVNQDGWILADFEPQMYSTIAALKEALAQPEGCQCPACKVTPHASDCAVHNEPAYPKGVCNCRAQPEQEPVAYDKTEMNCFVQDLYDKKMQEGKQGHYETMFHVFHQAIKRIQPQRPWQGLADEEIKALASWRPSYDQMPALMVLAKDIQNSLKERNNG